MPTYLGGGLSSQEIADYNALVATIANDAIMVPPLPTSAASASNEWFSFEQTTPSPSDMLLMNSHAKPKTCAKDKKALHKAAAKKDAQIASLETSVRQKDYVVAALLGVVETCLAGRERDGKTEDIVKVRDVAIEKYAESLEEDAKREKSRKGVDEGWFE